MKQDIRSWTEDAACHPRHGHNPSMWFPEVGWSHLHPYVRLAKKVCAGCDVRQRCLDYSLTDEPYGIWGGMTEQERERYRRQHRMKLILWRR